MGVTGLWQLLSDVGRPVALETLEGKVLAVDVSIWLHQALKGMRDRQGNPVQNAHLISLFNKVCKLLFYRIKPVFVFDGGVPALKKKTLAGRRERKEEAERESQKTAKKMLLNYLKSYAIQQVTGSEPPEPVSLPSTSKSEPDMFNLPAIPLRKESDDESESDDGTYQTQFENLLDIDIDSADFQALPSEMQHEILSEIKDRRKFNYWAQAEDLPEDSNDFSEYQMKKLLKQSKLSSRIEDVRKDMNVQQTGELTGEFGKDLYGSCEVVSRRVVSDDTSHFILVKGLAKKKKQHELAQKKEQQRLEDLRKYFEEIPSDGNSNDSDSASNSKHSRVKNMDLEGNSNDSNSKFSREENIELDSVSSSISRNKGKKGKNIKVDLTSDVKIKAIDSIDLTGSNYDTDNFICSRNSTHTTTEIDHNIRTGASLKSDELQELTVEELILKRAASPFSEYSAVEELDECSVSPPKMPKYGTDGSSIINFEQENTSTKMLGTTLEKSDFSQRSVSNSDGKDTDDAIPVLVDNEVPCIDVNTSGKVEENLFNSLGKGESFKEKPITEKSGENQETVSGIGPPDITSPSDKSSAENARIMMVEQQLTGETSAKETEEESSFEESAKAVDDKEGLIVNKTDVSEGKETCEQMERRVSTTTLSSDEEEEDFIEIPELPSAVDSLRNLPAPSMDASFSETTSTAEQDGVATDRGNNSDVELTGSQEESSHYFTSQLKALSEEGVSNLQKELRAESATLQAQRGKQQRQAVSMSDHIYAQAQEMLGMFGLPYLVSPMEAEAQCAYLDLCGLTQGTITDDSDVWLFGGRRVYKNFFNKGKLVEFFRIEDCVAQFGLDRDQLINIALLCGSDYTHGIQGVGPVTAQEILEQFPGLDCLKDLKKWWKKAHKKPVAMSDTKLLAKLRQVKLQPGFPDQQVVEAYLHPEVDDSTEPFSWGIPELDSLRDYMRENLGWPQAKTDEILVPVIKELNKPQTQGRITSFFTPEAHALAQKLKAVKAKKLTTGQKRAAGPKAAKQSTRKRTAPQKPRKPAVTKVVCLSESSSSEESDSSNESSSCDSGSDEFEAVEDIEQSSSKNLKDIKASTSGKLISGNKQRKKIERSTEIVAKDIKNAKNGAAKGKGPSKKSAGTSNSKYSKRALASHMPL